MSKFTMPLQTDPPRMFIFEATELHRLQAIHNHGQTLEGLAKRGGMSLCEMASILESRRWHSMPPDAARAVLDAYGEVN